MWYERHGYSAGLILTERRTRFTTDELFIPEKNHKSRIKRVSSYVVKKVRYDKDNNASK